MIVHPSGPDRRIKTKDNDLWTLSPHVAQLSIIKTNLHCGIALKWCSFYFVSLYRFFESRRSFL